MPCPKHGNMFVDRSNFASCPPFSSRKFPGDWIFYDFLFARITWQTISCHERHYLHLHPVDHSVAVSEIYQTKIFSPQIPARHLLRLLYLHNAWSPKDGTCLGPAGVDGNPRFEGKNVEMSDSLIYLSAKHLEIFHLFEGDECEHHRVETQNRWVKFP